ncbi:MAG: DUF669 domain-containing protein [Prevotella sp.]
MTNENYEVMDGLWSDEEMVTAIENAEKNSGWTDLPDGTYNMEFKGLETSESTKGNHKFSFEFEVMDGPLVGRKEFHKMYANNVCKVDKTDSSPEAEYRNSPLDVLAKGIAKIRRFLDSMQVFDTNTIPMFTKIKDDDWETSDDVEFCKSVLNEMDYSNVVFVCTIKTIKTFRNFTIKDVTAIP